jgi:hypothetical protein
MYKYVTIFLILSLSQNYAFTQKSEIFAGTDIPLFYTVGYRYTIGQFKLDFKSGVLTKPYDKAVLKILDIFDTDQVLLNTIGESFSVGYNLQPALRWHTGKYFISVHYSYLGLHANNSPVTAIEDHYGITFPDRQAKTFTLESALHNAGFTAGREFNPNWPGFSLNLELSFAKTFKSFSKVKNIEGDELRFISGILNDELDYYYKKYSYLPSINVYLVYHIKGKQLTNNNIKNNF